MSEYFYEVTDGVLDTIKYRKSTDGSDCDSSEEFGSTIIGQLGACCFPNGQCLQGIDKVRCLEAGGSFYADQKCMNIECPLPSPSPMSGLSVKVY